MDKSLAAKLARNGVLTRDDLADLATDELVEYSGIDAEQAGDYLAELQRSGRYAKDVY